MTDVLSETIDDLDGILSPSRRTIRAAIAAEPSIKRRIESIATGDADAADLDELNADVCLFAVGEPLLSDSVSE